MDVFLKVYYQTETQVSAPLAGRVRNITRKGVALKEGDILAEIEY
jgi:biotin carboxyl carrier protein